MISGVILNITQSHSVQKYKCNLWSLEVEVSSLIFSSLAYMFFFYFIPLILCCFVFSRGITYCIWWSSSFPNSVLILCHFHSMFSSHLSSAKVRLITPLVSYGWNPQDNVLYGDWVTFSKYFFKWCILMRLKLFDTILLSKVARTYNFRIVFFKMQVLTH